MNPTDSVGLVDDKNRALHVRFLAAEYRDLEQKLQESDNCKLSAFYYGRAISHGIRISEILALPFHDRDQ